MRFAICLLVSVLGSTLEFQAKSFCKTMGRPDRTEMGMTMHRTPDGKVFLGGIAGETLVWYMTPIGRTLSWSPT